MPIEDGYEKEPNHGFTVHSNDAVRDESMRDLELIGLITVLRSLPPNWILYPSWLREKFNLGRDKVQSLLGKLTERGYLDRKRKRNQNGTLGGYVFKVKNTIISKAEPQPDFQGLGSQPQPENQAAPLPKNQGAIVTIQNLSNTHSGSPDGSRLPKSRKPNGQHDYGESFEQLWIAYGRYGNKKPAAQEFGKLSPELQAEVIAAVPGYLKAVPKDKTGREMKFNLERFIANEVYKRHATTESVKRELPAPETITRPRWEIILGTWRRNGKWYDAAHGPLPGMPGSFVPLDLLTPEEVEEANDRIMGHERRTGEEGIRQLPGRAPPRPEIPAAASVGPTPAMDSGRLPCGVLPGLSAGGSGGAGEEIHTGE